MKSAQTVLALVVVSLSAAAPAVATGTLAVRGGVVHTAAGPPIRDGVVLVREGKIVAVGPAGEVAIPPGTRTLEAAVVTPGLVDAHTAVGLTGHLNQRQDQDQIETSAAVQPELRAVDAYDARERLVGWVRSFGVTTIHTGHVPGAVISGQTMIAKTRGDTVGDSVLVPRAMLAVTLGEGALDGGAPGRHPGTRAKAVAMLRTALVAARDYAERRDRAEADRRPPRDLRHEALAAVLARDLPLLVTADRHHDILSALRVAEEFDIRVVLDGAAEAYDLVDEIREAGVPVIVHPAMQRPHGAQENLGFETAGRLAAAGVPIALQSGYESYVPKTRVVLFEAAVHAAHGLGFEGALRALTVDAARILGIEDRVGSLEPGKDGDLALYDGDPFEYATHCVGVVIEGEVVSDAPR